MLSKHKCTVVGHTFGFLFQLSTKKNWTEPYSSPRILMYSECLVRYVEQLVASAEAAVEEVIQRGVSCFILLYMTIIVWYWIKLWWNLWFTLFKVAHPGKIAVGGHSYGAFMTANLLAHAPHIFCCGIARSGAYNRTLTPFGFQVALLVEMGGSLMIFSNWAMFTVFLLPLFRVLLLAGYWLLSLYWHRMRTEHSGRPRVRMWRWALSCQQTKLKSPYYLFMEKKITIPEL